MAKKNTRVHEANPGAPGPKALDGLGAQVKLQRRKSGWTLQQLSDACGVSVAAISKIENGQSRPNFETILRIARGLRFNFVDMMESPAQPPASIARLVTTRVGEAPVYETAHYRYDVHATALTRKVMIPLQTKVKGRTAPPPDEWSCHDGEEFLLVLRGAVTLLTDQYAPLTLKEGESCYFDSTMRHAVVSALESPGEYISVCLSVGSLERIAGQFGK